jgi:uncharacterized Tic20 family protein
MTDNSDATPPPGAPDPAGTPQTPGSPQTPGTPQTPGSPPPPGYQAPGYPPPPSYPPPGAGYGAPPYGTPGYGPPGPASSEDRTWVLFAHFGGALGVFLLWGWGGWIAPLIALAGRGNQSPLVRAHAVEALNFQLTWLLADLVALVIAVCGAVFIVPLLLLALPVVPIVFGIIAGVKAMNGEPYRYPLTLRLIS